MFGAWLAPFGSCSWTKQWLCWVNSYMKPLISLQVTCHTLIFTAILINNLAISLTPTFLKYTSLQTEWPLQMLVTLVEMPIVFSPVVHQAGSDVVRLWSLACIFLSFCMKIAEYYGKLLPVILATCGLSAAVGRLTDHSVQVFGWAVILSSVISSIWFHWHPEIQRTI